MKAKDKNTNTLDKLRRKLGLAIWAAPVASIITIPQHATATETTAGATVTPCSDQTITVSAGDSDTITIPDNVSSITFSVIGASGGKGSDDTRPASSSNGRGADGGVGWAITGTMSVVAGQQISLISSAQGQEGTKAPGNIGNNPAAVNAYQPLGGIGGVGFTNGGNGGEAQNGTRPDFRNIASGGGGGGGSSALLVDGQQVIIAAGGGGAAAAAFISTVQHPGGDAFDSGAAGQPNGIVGYFPTTTGANESAGNGGNGGNVIAQDTDGGGSGATGGGGGGGFIGGGGGCGNVNQRQGNAQRGGYGGVSLINTPTNNAINLQSSVLASQGQGMVEITLNCN